MIRPVEVQLGFTHNSRCRPVETTTTATMHAVRVRIAPPGSPGIVEPPLMALLPTPPSVAAAPVVGLTSLQQGNLLVSFDAASGFITATRVSDGAVLLQTANITWGAPAPDSRPNSVSANITCVWGGRAQTHSVPGRMILQPCGRLTQLTARNARRLQVCGSPWRGDLRHGRAS